MLKRFDWMKVPPLCFCAGNFVPKIARSTPVLRYKPNGGDGVSYSWAPADFLFQLFTQLKLFIRELGRFFSYRTVTTANVIFQHVLFEMLHFFALGVFLPSVIFGKKGRIPLNLVCKDWS